MFEPGEYRLRMFGWKGVVLAVKNGKAIGYSVAPDGEVGSEDWCADTGDYKKGYTSTMDLMPPQPEIDIPHDVIVKMAKAHREIGFAEVGRIAIRWDRKQRGRE